MIKNITFTAEECLIHQAQERALKDKISLNLVFRAWLKEYAKDETPPVEYYTLMQRLRHINSSKHFSRDEFNN